MPKSHMIYNKQSDCKSFDRDLDDNFFDILTTQGFLGRFFNYWEKKRLFKATHCFFSQKEITPDKKIKEFYMRLNALSFERAKILYTEIRNFGELVKLSAEDQKKFDALLQYAQLLGSINPHDFGFTAKTKVFN